MSREYDQLAWVDYPETLTPISAANLNRMENGIANLYTDRNKMESNIAYVEEGETATRHYFINSYLMLNGIFYKTTSEINVGDILDPTLAGNIEHVDVSSQFGSAACGSAASFGDADHVAYDNTQSGLEATDVQAALDELGGFANHAIKVYGDAGGSGYTDFNDFPGGTVFWANNTGTHPYTNAPGDSAYHVLTACPSATHGFQIAVRYNGTGLHRRTRVDGTWGDWNNVLDDTGQLTAGSKFGGIVYYRKLNGVVNVYMTNTQLTGMTANTDNVIATVPAGYRPLGLSAISSLYGNSGFAYVSSNGQVTVHPPAASMYIGFSFTYLAVQ